MDRVGRHTLLHRYTQPVFLVRLAHIAALVAVQRTQSKVYYQPFSALGGSMAVGIHSGCPPIGYWPTYARGWPAIMAFIVFGPIGEELLFRGMIFERARRLWATSARPAIWISTIAFSLHHIQLHRLPLDGAALAQIGFTLPMRLVFAQLRERSGSLWPALVLHVATNLPFIF
jgi:membrane protease YdiL (CAAX protease family)